jgi:hypothetical protein
MRGTILSIACAALVMACNAQVAEAAASLAIVAADSVVLRAAPREGAQQQAQIFAGELLEVRGERIDHLQVWSHQRERGGFVKASQVRRIELTPAQAPQLLAVVRFLRESPGDEALGIAYVAAYMQAASSESLRGAEGIEAFDALGTMADRLAHRVSFGASPPRSQQAALASRLDVAAHYGVAFRSFERDGRMQVCYDGEAFKQVLNSPAASVSPEQRARAALGVTRSECVPPDLRPLEHAQVNEWRAEMLDRVETQSLPGWLKNRVVLRRAAVWSTVAFERARQQQGADFAAQRALSELAAVNKGELTDVDQAAYAEAAMRTGASRWAAVSAPADATLSTRPSITTTAGAPGEICVLLVDAKNDASHPLAKRCTYALVWPQSASLNREGNALVLAVQPLEAWRELWVFRRQAKGWTVDVLPPAPTSPEAGYAEFAGWVPGGAQLLVAREATSGGKARRSFEVVDIATLATKRRSGDASALGSFQRWQDAAWKRATVALR